MELLRFTLFAPLDDLLKVALKNLDGPFGPDSVPEDAVELLGHRARRLRVVRRDRLGPGVLERLFAHGDHRHCLLYPRVLVERLQCQDLARYSQFLARFVGYKANELPGCVLHLRGGVDQDVLPSEAVSSLALSVPNGQRRDPHLLGPYFQLTRTSVWIARQRVYVGSVAAEDGIASEEGRMRLWLDVIGHRLRGYPVRDHALLGDETCNRFGAVYDHFVGVVGVNDFPAVGPDELEAVAQPS